jgi:alpha-D-ribose 1-methylphosphonate 5-triphosphate synthase subunit PhnH
MSASSNPAIFEGGFADPVFGAQSAFRGVMDAMANPGRVVDLGGAASAPAPLDHAGTAILAALADYDTPVWLEAETTADAAAWLAFQTGAPVTSDAAAAAFAVLEQASAVDGWSRFAIGTSSYPDRSATLILPVDDLVSGPALTLKGPGIETTTSLSPAGLPAGFVPAMAANAALFPLGFDLILVAGSTIAALPRTARIVEA